MLDECARTYIHLLFNVHIYSKFEPSQNQVYLNFNVLCINFDTKPKTELNRNQAGRAKPIKSLFRRVQRLLFHIYLPISSLLR